MAARSVVVLGSTGSVGVSTLDLLARVEEPVDMLALTAGRNVACLADQALRWRPQVAVIQDETRLPELRERLSGSGIAAAAGASAIIDAAAQGADWVMSAIVGAAGLAPTSPPLGPGRRLGSPIRRVLCALVPRCLRSPKPREAG